MFKKSLRALSTGQQKGGFHLPKDILSQVMKNRETSQQTGDSDYGLNLKPLVVCGPSQAGKVSLL